jgi:ATP-dependent DNA helicase RecG
MYQVKGDQVAYTRQASFTRLQNEQMVVSHVQHHGQIKRADVMELCHLDKDQAANLLKKLKEEEKLQQHGERRGAYYTMPGE